ncbi:MAG: 3-hydroxybutyryl-CoA dehydrogenase [Chitinophagales bacterium]|nr:3-hydroxybutyryl-CoA dehydrogenase [Chitinophagales bacterium]
MQQSIQSVCVIGAGTMGSGIALSAAQSGFPVILFDINQAVLDKAITSVQKNLQFLVDKQKISAGEKETVFNRIQFISEIHQCKADVIIEAIIEKTEAKVSVFNQLAAVNSADTIFASNTSSLSISDIQAHVDHPERVVGMHFFNPAHVMKLVEVVKGAQTAEAVAQQIYDLCLRLKKTPVMCKDAPGFIVNRVARHYYLEAMKLVETGVAGLETVDEVMEASGFKMGPFRLMDLIGMDINLTVSQSLYEAFDKAERFTPSPLQIDKVAKGDLGKKTGKGFYQY